MKLFYFSSFKFKDAYDVLLPPLFRNIARRITSVTQCRYSTLRPWYLYWYTHIHIYIYVTSITRMTSTYPYIYSVTKNVGEESNGFAVKVRRTRVLYTYSCLVYIRQRSTVCLYELFLQTTSITKDKRR